jgi:hypothetical protein
MPFSLNSELTVKVAVRLQVSAVLRTNTVAQETASPVHVELVIRWLRRTALAGQVSAVYYVPIRVLDLAVVVRLNCNTMLRKITDYL